MTQPGEEYLRKFPLKITLKKNKSLILRPNREDCPAYGAGQPFNP